MMWKLSSALAFLPALAVTGLPGPAHAHEEAPFGVESEYRDPDAEPAPTADDEHRWSAHGGLGFGLSPSSFAFGVGVEYHVVHEVGVGPMLQLMAEDDTTVVIATLNTRYHFGLGDVDDDFVSRLEPFVQGGLGLAHVEKERPGRDPDDTDLLLNGGFGVDYRLNEQLSVGTTLMFHGIPGDEAVGEEFFFTWQVLGARYHF